MRIPVGKLIVAGMKTPAGQVAGHYRPSNGTTNACFMTTCFIVNPKWRDKEGNLQEKKETIFLQVWNNTNGGQHADNFAKYVSIGKTLEDCVVERSQYLTQAKGPQGELLVKPDGSAFMIEKESYTLVRYSLGRDSNKVVEAEVAAWQGTINFASRPPFWNGCPAFLLAMGRVQLQEVEDGKKLWAQVQQARSAATYVPGQQYFGYALVKTPAAAATPNNGVINTGAPGTMVNTVAAPVLGGQVTTPTEAAAHVANNGGIVTPVQPPPAIGEAATM